MASGQPSAPAAIVSTPAPSTGSPLSNYEVLDRLGAGGMGEVYLARDRRLERHVALKFVAAKLLQDPRSMARLRREARLLAALKHPNIAAIHDLLEEDGRAVLVLEYVEGESLRERLDRGPVPMEEALSIGSQVASALAAAHEEGVIHRDVKPGNVRIRPDGLAKLLDFGIGKMVSGDSVPGGAPETLTHERTEDAVVGTPGYLSPEQARGAAVDRRTDAWSFGCLLFEMLAGQPAFPGATSTDRIASVLKDAPDWSLLPDTTPEVVREVLRQCLKKEPDRRLRDLADARLLLDGSRGETTPRSGRHPATPSEPRRMTSIRSRQALLVVGAGAVVAAVAWLGLQAGRGARAASPEPVEYLAFPTSAAPVLHVDSSMDLSSDGRVLVFSDGSGSIRVEDRGRPVGWRIIAGLQPFLSADGRTIGAFAQGPLSVSVRGGSPVRLAPPFEMRVGAGGCWLPDGSILFAADLAGPILRVPAGGGEPQPATRLDESRREVSHRWPHPLPDGSGFVYTAKSADLASFDDATIRLHLFEGGEDRVLLQGGSDGRVTSTGHLVFGRKGALLAVALDPSTLAAEGPPAIVQEGVATDPATGKAWFALAGNADLAYFDGGPVTRDSRFLWIDDAGRTRDAGLSIAAHGAVLSPDGKRVAVVRYGANDKIWLADLELGVTRQLTFGPGNDHDVKWSLDGTRLAFVSDRTGSRGIYVVDADGTAPERAVLESVDGVIYAIATHADGIACFVARDGGMDEILVPWDGATAPVLIARRPEMIWGASIAPGGNLLAVRADKTGHVYVEQFPGPGVRLQGREADSLAWSTDGSLLVTSGPNPFPGSIHLTPVEPGPTLRLGTPVLVATRSDLNIVGAVGRNVLAHQVAERPAPQARLVLGFASVLDREAAHDDR